MELREILTQHYRVSQKAIEAFASACELVSCEPMVKVVEQGRVADSLWITRQGVARIVFEGDEGESTVAFGSDGDVFTSVHSFHCGQPSKFSLETLVKTDFYRIGFTDLKRLLHEYENLLMWFVGVCLDELYGLEMRYSCFGTGDAYSRDCTLMQRRQDILNRIPLKYVAQYLHVTQSTLSRLRARYGREG